MVILTEKAKKILISNKSEEEEKDNFYLQFVSKITEKVTQKLKKKKEQIFRENIYRHHVKINQIKLFA
jgi:glutaredoxin 2